MALVLSPMKGMASDVSSARTAATEAAVAATEAAAAATAAAAAATEAAGAAAAVQYPYTPRHDAAWTADEPPAALVEQCLRPGHCGLTNGDELEWLHSRLFALGRAFNERGEQQLRASKHLAFSSKHLMALTCFACCYAIRPGAVELLSAANMRLKLGQRALARRLYERVLGMGDALAEPERRVAERKLREATTGTAAEPPPAADAADAASSRSSSSSSSTAPAAGLSSLYLADAELVSLLSSPDVADRALEPAERERMLPLLRGAAVDASHAADYEAAAGWFDAAFALSAATHDLLAAANMRVQVRSRPSLAFSGLS